MPKSDIIQPVHIDGFGPMDRNLVGCHTMLLAQITYPGSKVTDILVGGHKVQIPNEALRLAAQEHDEHCDTEGG